LFISLYVHLFVIGIPVLKSYFDDVQKEWSEKNIWT